VHASEQADIDFTHSLIMAFTTLSSSPHLYHHGNTSLPIRNKLWPS
jgi:hypothetical protein